MKELKLIETLEDCHNLPSEKGYVAEYLKDEEGKFYLKVHKGLNVYAVFLLNRSMTRFLKSLGFLFITGREKREQIVLEELEGWDFPFVRGGDNFYIAYDNLKEQYVKRNAKIIPINDKKYFTEKLVDQVIEELNEIKGI